MSSQKDDLARSTVSLRTHTQDTQWGKYQMREQEHRVADSGDRLCQRYHQWIQRNGWGFFSPQNISRSFQPLFFFPRTFAHVDKILPPPPKKFVTLLQIQTVFVGGSNERPGLTDTINIAHVFNKDVFAYKCPLPFLCLQMFALVATVVILHWLNCLTVPVENAKSRYPMCSRESQTFLCPFLNFSRRQNNYPVMQCCLGGVGVVGWGGVVCCSLSLLSVLHLLANFVAQDLVPVDLGACHRKLAA